MSNIATLSLANIPWAQLHNASRDTALPLRLPLLNIDTLGRNRVDLLPLHIVPVGAEAGPVALGKRLDHGALLLVRRPGVERLEKVIHPFLFLIDVLLVLHYLVPVLRAFARRCRVSWLTAGCCRRSRRCGRRGRTRRSRGGARGRGVALPAQGGPLDRLGFAQVELDFIGGDGAFGLGRVDVAVEENLVPAVVSWDMA